MVVFDTTTALLFLRPGTNPPLDPATGNPVEHAEARIALLVETLEKAKYEAIKQSLLPGVRFDTATHLTPLPERFPRIIMRPQVAYGQPTGPSRVPTEVLFDAWMAENKNADAVSHWYEVPLGEVLEAIDFEQQLDRPNEAREA